MPDDGMQKQLYGIAIFEEEIVLSDFTGETERRYVVAPEQLMAFVSSEVTFKPFPGLIWMKSAAQQDVYLLTLPAAVRPILYRKKGKKVAVMKLALPPIAVQASIEKASRKITNIQIWGLAKRGLDRESILYELPLPNLSGSSLCLGSTMVTGDNDVLEAVVKTIFDTPFNHHNHIVSLDKVPFHDYAKKHAGKCPLRTLKKIGTGRDILGRLV